MIDRDDPYHVILKVSLPGFSLDNITVAMRRGHRVHIVADSYGENGGESNLMPLPLTWMVMPVSDTIRLIF